MAELTMQILSDFGRKSSSELSTQNAWALYARRRWPANGVKLAMAEWGLTEGQAKGLIAGTVTQPTIDKIIDHPRGGFGLGLLILEIRTQTALRSWINDKREEEARAAARHAAEMAALDEMARDLPVALGVGVPREPCVAPSGRRELASVRGQSGSQSDRMGG